MCILVARPDEQRPLGRPNHRCNDNVKIDLEEKNGSVLTELILIRLDRIVGMLWEW